MSTLREEKALIEAEERLRLAQRETDRLRRMRDRRIVRAVSAGVSVTATARLTGLSRPGVQQVLRKAAAAAGGEL